MEQLKLSERQKKLVQYIQQLDPKKRHTIKLICRGNEPWEIEEHVTSTKIELIPNK